MQDPAPLAPSALPTPPSAKPAAQMWSPSASDSEGDAHAECRARKRARRTFKAEELDACLSSVLSKHVVQREVLQGIFTEMNASLGSQVFPDGVKEGAFSRSEKRKRDWTPSKPLCSLYLLQRLSDTLLNDRSVPGVKFSAFDKTKVLSGAIVDAVLKTPRFLEDKRLVESGEVTEAQAQQARDGDGSSLRNILSQLMGQLMAAVSRHASSWAQSGEIVVEARSHILPPIKTSKGTGLLYPTCVELHVRRAVIHLAEAVQCSVGC